MAFGCLRRMARESTNLKVRCWKIHFSNGVMIMNKYLILLWLGFPGLVWGTTYYVDPEHGRPDNPGTLELPLQSLQEVTGGKAALKAGDRIILRGGNYGAVTLRGENEGVVTIENYPGEHPTLSRLRTGKARNWHFKGIEFAPDLEKMERPYTLVDTAGDASELVFENCLLYSARDTAEWSAEDWVKQSCSGFLIRGDRNRIMNNRLLNVDHGISVDGNDNIVENNTVENFSGDGMRALGDRCVYRYNVIRNCYDVDENHDDGIQSWSVGPEGVGSGVVKDVLIEGNLIINYTDPKQKHRGTLQGIGCFDGYYEGWTIVNNIIMIDHWHGITLLGARNCRIINNTVVDLNDVKPGPPWIMIAKHKKKTESTGNLIRNNLSPKIASQLEVGQIDHNLTITDYDKFFVDYAKRDLRLKADAPARDAGNNEFIPKLDFFRKPRLVGDTVDMGAVEYEAAKP